MTIRPLYTLPIPPSADSADYPYYQAFLHSMNRCEGRTIAGKIALSIEMTAELCQTSPAHIARVLVDCGLRAPRDAFPASFVEFIETPPNAHASRPSGGFELDAVELQDFWRSLLPPTAGMPAEACEMETMA